MNEVPVRINPIVRSESLVLQVVCNGALALPKHSPTARPIVKSIKTLELGCHSA
jgi:hypothetical protein